MALNNRESVFLAKRAQRVRAWRLVGPIVLVMLTGLGLWLFLTKPLLANPFLVLTRLTAESIPDSTLVMMASLLPVALLICIVLSIFMVLFMFAAFSNEKRYLEIIKAMKNNPGAAPPQGRSEPRPINATAGSKGYGRED